VSGFHPSYFAGRFTARIERWQLSPAHHPACQRRNNSLAHANLIVLIILSEMDATPPPAPVEAFAPELSRRVGIVLCALYALIARRFALNPRLIALSIPLCRRITRARLRFERLMARLAAGPLPQPKPRKPHPGGPHKPCVIPRDRWWLVRTLGWEVNGCASQLEAVLAGPEAAALLAEIPAALRILAPIRRLLAIGARNRPLRNPPAVVPKFCALPAALSTEWGRPPDSETWHRFSVGFTKPAWP
jgi:hypothetical protein